MYEMLWFVSGLLVGGALGAALIYWQSPNVTVTRLDRETLEKMTETCGQGWPKG